MSDYTVVKVSDVPDQGANLGVAPDVEIRFLRNDLGCEDCGVSYARIAPNGKRPSGHRHKRQEEIYLLVSGSARIKVGDDIVDLEPWTAVRVPAETTRALAAGPGRSGIRPRRRAEHGAGRRDRRARFLEGLGSGDPAADATSVVLVLGPETLAELGLLVQHDEEVEEKCRGAGPQ